MAMAKHNSSTVSWRNAAGRRPRSDRDCLRGVGEAGTALLGQRIVRLDSSEKGLGTQKAQPARLGQFDMWQ